MNARLAPLLLALALASIPTTGRTASGWTLTGYALEDGTEWFSLRAQDGTSAWVAAGKPGPVAVKYFDRATLTLVIEAGGRTERLAMPEARIGEAALPIAAEPPALPRVALPTLPPLKTRPDGTVDPAQAQARASLEKLQVSYAAVRIEQAEAQRERDVALVARRREAGAAPVSSPQIQAEVATDARASAAATPANTTARPAKTGGEPDWAEIYRQTAIRNAAYQALLAEQRLQREQRR